MEYQMEPSFTPPICGAQRDHMRLFGGFVQDSHTPSMGWWSVSDAHHDNDGHTCTDDWDGAQARLRDSFKDANGNYYWFVAQAWMTNLGYAGTYQCAYSDGWADFLELSA